MGTIVVAGILLLCVAGILTSLRHDRKNGRSACGGNCTNCKGCRH